MTLEQVFDWRCLMSKAGRGDGLSWDEVLRLSVLEAAFANHEHSGPALPRRVHRRDAVGYLGMLRGPGIYERVGVRELSPGGLALTAAPFVDLDDRLDVQIEDRDRALSYRFKVQVVWRKPDGAAYQLGAMFLGAPVLVHYGDSTKVASIVDQIAA